MSATVLVYPPGVGTPEPPPSVVSGFSQDPCHFETAPVEQGGNRGLERQGHAVGKGRTSNLKLRDVKACAFPPLMGPVIG